MPYKKSLKYASILHATILVVLVVAGFFKGCSTHKTPEEIPIEFTVAIPEELVQQPEPETSLNEPEDAPPEESEPEEPEPEEQNIKVEPKKPELPKEEPKKPEPPKPKEKPKKKPIKVSTTIVRRNEPKQIIKVPRNTPTVKSNDLNLTPQEIQKLLDMGAKASDHTSTPGENQRCLLSIKETLYAAWIRPSAEHCTGRPVEVEISISKYGTLIKHQLTRSSGNAILDKSVLSAIAATRTFRNLTPAFTKAYPTITIEFELD